MPCQLHSGLRNACCAKLSRMSEPVLLIVSDRAFVWRGYRALNRTVRRWIGERTADEPQPESGAFTGDPTLAETYRHAIADANLCAVIDIQDPDRARGAIAALRQIRPEAAVLVITADGDLRAPDVAASRCLAWTDALRIDLDNELEQLETQRRVHDLRAFAESAEYLPIIVHPDPDPDALASALALRALLRREADVTPIVTLDDMTRPENRRMAELLGMRVTVVTEDELSKMHHMIAIDHQPLQLQDITHAVAVIDHHPVEQQVAWRHADLRPTYGATATLLTEYLRADDEKRIDETLATALVYGIKTDTDSLTRGVSGADVRAYAYLLSQCKHPLLRKLERPSYKEASARAFGAALANLGIKDDVAVAFVGKLDDEDTHMLVEVADFCMALENITWSAAAGVIDDQIVFTLRHLGGSVGAGDLARELAGEEGNGGGHATMARARVPLDGDWKKLVGADIKSGTAELLKRVAAVVEKLRASHQSSRPAHQAKDHPAASQ
jgi:nanoRNase/pAp phosphatase (c-di-AMP/oligoRNAs hydrolase)